MSIQTAKLYFERADDSASSVVDIVDLFTHDAVLKSPREGIFSGQSELEQFFELNEDFFDSGRHDMTSFYEVDATIICEGTISGETSNGRRYEGIGLVDVMEFDGHKIAELRVYLDYSGILSELPESVPDFRELSHE